MTLSSLDSLFFLRDKALINTVFILYCTVILTFWVVKRPHFTEGKAGGTPGPPHSNLLYLYLIFVGGRMNTTSFWSYNQICKWTYNLFWFSNVSTTLLSSFPYASLIFIDPYSMIRQHSPSPRADGLAFCQRSLLKSFLIHSFFFFSFLNSGALIIETNWLSNCFHAFSQSRPALPRTLSLIVLVLVIIICNPGLIDPRPNIFFFSFTFWEWYCKDFSLFTCTLWSSD